MIDYKKPSILKDVQTTTSDSAVLKEDELMKPEKQKLKCEKCGRKRIRSCFHGTLYCCWSTSGNYSEEDHEHFFCINCLYDWIGPVKKEEKKCCA